MPTSKIGAGWRIAMPFFSNAILLTRLRDRPTTDYAKRSMKKGMRRTPRTCKRGGAEKGAEVVPPPNLASVEHHPHARTWRQRVIARKSRRSNPSSR